MDETMRLLQMEKLNDEMQKYEKNLIRMKRNRNFSNN